MSWELYTACPLHDGSKALEWAVRPWLDNEESDMKDFFIVVESIRNSFMQLHRHLKTWICDNLLLHDEPFDFESRKS